MKTLYFIFYVLLAGFSASSAAVYNVKDFGAVGDGIAMETEALQAAIDACSAAGGGTVWLPPGDYQTGTLHLKSDIVLSLDYGASILGSQDLADYPVGKLREAREGGPHCLLYAEDASNITIEGLGVIDGRGTHLAFPRAKDGSLKNGRLPRPRLMRFENCKYLKFSGVTYKNPAFWGLHLVDCKEVHFNGVTLRMRNNNYNNDGLDLDGCENVLIENSDIIAGDDAICLKSSLNPCRNITIRNCSVSSNTAALKFGTSSRGGFIDVNVSNCYFYDSPMGAIKLQVVDGGILENVDISRIVMKNVGNPIFLRLGNRGRDFTKDNNSDRGQGADVEPEGVPVGQFRNVRIRDVYAEVTIEDRAKTIAAPYKNLKLNRTPGITDEEKSKAGPIMITGIPEHLIENVHLENIEISYPGHGSEQDAQREVAEDIARYPEQFFFGVLPAWGAYIRHAKNVEFKNVTMTTRSPDAREKIVMVDVEGVQLH
ncbi:glycoside hydrolase family 28 protein [Coraliomargarita algicola]|uniref:Glycoside hydrolase family 28 protein n=1 Tax=Coraliomargarita algicola TaxID=3092156 RepID=A0ABZ0RN94_9BACT|nr:glycoside hydrolase family 28 protein [Coraliomargarita sp. J2-16]WPJ96606.1 glycoside hydrolase family 28 protein [Coraliomargarita sp. J2-16]